jgi:hypothetical protein
MHPAARSSLRRAVCVALLLTPLGACMTWRPVPGTLDQQVGAEPISRARVRLRSGAELSLYNVTVRPDSVIGYTEGRRAVSVADVASIDRRQLSAGRTAGVVVGAAAVAVVAMYGLAISALGNDINAVPAPGAP